MCQLLQSSEASLENRALGTLWDYLKSLFVWVIVPLRDRYSTGWTISQCQCEKDVYCFDSFRCSASRSGLYRCQMFYAWCICAALLYFPWLSLFFDGPCLIDLGGLMGFNSWRETLAGWRKKEDIFSESAHLLILVVAWWSYVWRHLLQCLEWHHMYGC